MRKNSLPTTFDNPWNPWFQYDEWLAYDLRNGYGTNQALAKLSTSKSDVSVSDSEELIEVAIDELIDMLPSVYTRWYENASEKEVGGS